MYDCNKCESPFKMFSIFNLLPTHLNKFQCVNHPSYYINDETGIGETEVSNLTIEDNIYIIDYPSLLLST